MSAATLELLSQNFRVVTPKVSCSCSYNVRTSKKFVHYIITFCLIFRYWNETDFQIKCLTILQSNDKNYHSILKIFYYSNSCFLFFSCVIADRSSDILLKRRLWFKHCDSQFHFSDFNNNFIEFLKSLRIAISCATALSSLRFTTLPVLIKVDTSKAQSKQWFISLCLFNKCTYFNEMVLIQEVYQQLSHLESMYFIVNLYQWHQSITKVPNSDNLMNDERINDEGIKFESQLDTMDT